jgi:hypothetical protein
MGKSVVGRARDVGLEKVDDLVKQAMLNPDIARYLLGKVSIKPETRATVSLAQQLRRLSVFEPMSWDKYRTEASDASSSHWLKSEVRPCRTWFIRLAYFCSAILKDDDPRCVRWVDFWDVPTAGDDAADRVAGESYADMAISYARRINMPVFLYYVAFAIEIKIFYGIIERGPMEVAFFGPHCARFPTRVAVKQPMRGKRRSWLAGKAPENTAQKQSGRFQKGQSGNPNGRPPGSRNNPTQDPWEVIAIVRPTVLSFPWSEFSGPTAHSYDVFSLTLRLNGAISCRRVRWTTQAFAFRLHRNKHDDETLIPSCDGVARLMPGRSS